MQIQKPNRIKHTYTQTNPAIPDKVFPLLCPVREADWLPGWDPKLVLSKSGVAELECVFITESEGADSIWVISKHDVENYQVEMYKITPGHTVCKLGIKLRAEGETTKAEITYEHTSLGPLGDEFLAEFTAAWYEKFMQTWEQKINHYLQTGECLLD